MEGRGLVRSIEDGPDVPPGDGAVVTGRFVTRRTADLVRVTFADGTTLAGTRNHPVWAPDEGDWRGLGEFQPGQRVRTRSGFAIVARVESLPDVAPVYNLEVAGEHVYEVTELGILVHNALAWDCGEFLELRDNFLKGTLDPKEFKKYEEYADTLKRNFRKYMDPEDAAFFEKIKPDDMNDPHLHHILQKLAGSKELADEILQVQKTLWTKHKIDPFVSADILVWAPNKAGQHGKLPMRFVIDELNKAFKAGKDRDDIIDLLRSLGKIAANK